MEYPELKRAVREQHARLRRSVVLIEDKASGTQLIQELAADSGRSRPRIRDDVADQSDLMSLGVPR
jgi:phage terminase large subunit-like protein